MTSIFKDKYTLTQSVSKTILNVSDEIRLDLSLSLLKDTIFARVEGVVTDLNSNPIEGALVQVYDINLNPLIHTLTNQNGYFIFENNIPIPGLSSVSTFSSGEVQPFSYSPITYNISAISLGKKLKFSTSFTLQNGDIKIKDFILENDSGALLGAITGNVYDETSLNPISGAVLSMFKVNTDGSEVLIQRSFTNEYGSFIFPNLNLGNYKLRINSLGYLEKTVYSSITSSGQIVSLPIPMQADQNAAFGTISGTIVDNLNAPINRADVILYKVNEDNSLTPLGFTKTNISGVYLFVNVEPGTYKIKSNEFEIITIVN